MARNPLASSTFLLALVAASLGVGTLMSFLHQDFNWLSRFGGLVICWGILLLARPSLIGRDIEGHVYSDETDLSLFDPEHYRKLGETVPDWVVENVRSRRAVNWFGPPVCFVGTLANGFASLLNGAFGYAA